MFRKLASGAVIAALVATPLAAQSARAQLDRASAPVEGESELAGQGTIFFLVGIAVVAAAIVFLSEDDDDAPVSP